MHLLKYITAFLLCCSSAALATPAGEKPARDTTLDPLMELMKVEDFYANSQFLETVITYYHEDHDSVVVKDTLSGFLRTYDSKYYYKLDSIIQVQDALYNITLYTGEEKTMYVQEPVNIYKLIFQLDLLDTLLHIKYITNITLTDTANLRKIVFSFNNESPFMTYEALFDTSLHKLKSIHYRIKKQVVPVYEEAYTVSKYVDYRILFGGQIVYTTEMFPDILNAFNTQLLIKRLNGVFVPVAPYTDYEIIDATQQ